ncbi:helix-turn-helix domain-containing protein [Pedobacter sp. P351]|uniref:helix-turn-helix domain-containing protein n=1 Tax=Pedobacter superstes TaxID=3133441 RepID=UPI0030A220EB
MNKDIHVGELIEEVIRSNHLSISDVARKIHVNRRSVYNWFKQKALRPYTLHRICYVLAYEFSVKLPDYFKQELIDSSDFTPPSAENPPVKEGDPEASSVQYWINKYIYLLEKYNETLAKGVSKDDPSAKKINK